MCEGCNGSRGPVQGPHGDVGSMGMHNLGICECARGCKAHLHCAVMHLHVFMASSPPLQAWVGGCPPLPQRCQGRGHQRNKRRRHQRSQRRRPLRNQRRRHLWKEGVRLLGKPLAPWMRKRNGRRRRRSNHQDRRRRHLCLSL
jgi:hypothetical protein